MSTSPVHVVVLAGGDGTRLAPLTRALYGVDLPKQFATLVGERSLLQATVDRALFLTTDARCVSVVVSGSHEHVATSQLAGYPGVELIVQPRNLDTGPGLMLPLVRVLARSPDARVVFLPSDHYIPTPEPLMMALADAARGALADHVTLVGVEPTEPEVEYGWIVRGKPILATRGFAVERFCEKPPEPVAAALFAQGGLWNTFISSARAAVLWDLARRALPRHASLLERYATAIGGLDEDVALDYAYRTMARANFSRDVLSNLRGLAVVSVEGSGWTDWGSPARVFASLAGTVGHDQLVARITGPVALAG
jgi:mannose-1-phosphate guanylyltransferase